MGVGKRVKFAINLSLRIGSNYPAAMQVSNNRIAFLSGYRKMPDAGPTAPLPGILSWADRHVPGSDANQLRRSANVPVGATPNSARQSGDR
jgi:hypothetical protein